MTLPRRALCIAGLFALTLSLACTVACDGRPPTGGSGEPAGAAGAGGVPASPPRRGPAQIVFDLSAGVPEQEASSLLSVGGRRASFDGFVAAVEEARTQKDARSFFVRFGGVNMGMARATEIGELLEGLRKSGRTVACHAEGLGNATLHAAARGCSKITLSPPGEVEAVGLAVQIVYLRKLLVEELRLNVDILQVGKYKGAEEPLTRDGPSDEARATLESTLADIRASWIEGVKTGRAGKGDVEAAAEDGPFPAKAAVARGLVDDIAYVDEARDTARRESGAVRDLVVFGPGSDGASGVGDGPDLAQIVRVLAGDTSSSAPVALVRATGSIAQSGGGGLFGGNSGITEKELGRLLRRLEKDNAVKAVVLRIDSPGGSALASDLIWHELMKIRAKKPLVVSVGEMAASGGYYLASTGNVVFAEPTSILGSIGVVGGKFGVGQALERFGIHAETFPARRGDPKAAARAAYLSMFTAWDDATRQRMLESMKGVYDMFLERVSIGRKLPVERIAESAEGRLFSGREAKERGLIDELGGLSAAITRARSLAQLPEDARVGVVGGRPTLLDALAADPEPQEGASAPTSALPQAALAAALSGNTPPGTLPHALAGLAEVLTRSPSLGAFATSLLPLADGEKVLAAVPFALELR